MRLLVTGAEGMLGHRVVDVLKARGHDVRGTALPGLDLPSAAAGEPFVGPHPPDVEIT